jgi:hypothetical protein
MGELEAFGAITRERTKVAGTRGPGLVRYRMNERIATHFQGAARDKAQAAAAPLLELIDGGKSDKERTALIHPPEPSPGQMVRWTPIGRPQTEAQVLWGRDTWRVSCVHRTTDPELSVTSVMLVPMSDGRLRRGFVQSLLLSQIEGYGKT